MIFLHVQPLFAMRGIVNPITTLTKYGMPYDTAKRLLTKRQSSIKYAHMELLCEVLRCQPADLFGWKQDSGKVVDAEHPLHTLAQNAGAAAAVQQKLSKLSVGELRNLLK